MKNMIEEPKKEYLCKRENCEKKCFTLVKPDMPGDYVVGICKESNSRVYFNDICKCL